MIGESFAELLSDVLAHRGVTPGEVAAALRRRGLKVHRGTIIRWCNGDTRPSMAKLPIVKRLPEVLGLSTTERQVFLLAAGRALDFSLTPEAEHRDAATALAQRIHFGADVLPPFAGRENELARLQKVIRARQSVLITGLGGIGKTRLAQELLRSSVGYFAHGCEYLALTPGQESRLVIQNVAHLLGVALPSGGSAGSWPSDVLARLQARLRDANLLFLIDNVERAEQVADLVRELPSITWVFTARRAGLKSLGVHTVVLDLPSAEDALAIFLAHAGSVGNPADHDQALIMSAIRMAGRLPIAIRLMAGLVTYGFVHSSAELEAWSEGGLLHHGNHSRPLRWLFEQLVGSAPPEARAMFEVCGAFAGRIIAVPQLLAVCYRAGIDIAPQIWESLADLSLIDLPDDAHIELHPLLHEYARWRLRRSNHYSVVMEGYKAHYLALALSVSESIAEQQRDYQRLLPEEPNLLQVAGHFHEERDWPRLRTIWPAVSGFLWNTGNLDGYEAFDRQCLEAAQASEDLAWEAVLLSELGFVALEKGRWDEADELFSRSQAIHDATPGQLIEQARLRRYRASLALRRGATDEALGLLSDCERRLALLSNPPETRLEMALVLLHSVRMSVYFQRGELESAAAAGLMADRHYRQISLANNHRLGEYMLELADILFRLGDVSAAQELWSEIVYRRDGFTLLPEQGEAQLRLSWLAALDGDRDTAILFGQQSRQTFGHYARQDRVATVDALAAVIESGNEYPSFIDLTAGCIYPAY